MRDYPYFYFVNFASGLLLEEVCIGAVFPKRKKAPLFFPLALAAFYAAGFFLVQALRQIPVGNPGVTIVYYLIVAAMTGIVLAAGLQVPPQTIFFIVTLGYAAQHLGYALLDALNCIRRIMSGQMLYQGRSYARLLEWGLLILEGVCLFLLMRYLYRKGIVLKNVDVRMAVILAFVLTGSIVLSEFIPLQVSSEESLQIRAVARLYAVLVCAMGIGAAIGVTYLNRTEQDRHLIQQALGAEREQHRITQESIDLINMKCHDLRYQLRQLEGMSNQEQRHQSARKLEEAIEIYDNSIHTGSDPIDLVLTQKSLLCRKYDIKFSVMLNGAALDFMDASDVYAMFGNAMDNAIESVIKAPVEKRVITLQGHTADHFVLIHMDNYCEEPVSFQDGLPEHSSKEDGGSHGFGTRSIRYLAKQYGGNARMYWKDHVFNVDIMLPAA